MSNWVLDLNKLINTKEYPDIDLENSAHSVIASYSESTSEKERDNIKGNINLYINNLKDKINDPLILKKYNLLLTVEKELGVVDQTHPIVEIVSKSTGPKINTDPENMVMPSNIIVDKRNVKKEPLSYAEEDELLKMEEEAEEAAQATNPTGEVNDIEIPDKIDLGNGEVIDLHAPAPTTSKIYDNIPLETEEETKLREEALSRLENVSVPNPVKFDYGLDELKSEVESIVVEIDESKLLPEVVEEYNTNLTKFMSVYSSPWIPDNVKDTLLHEAYDKIKEVYDKYKNASSISDNMPESIKSLTPFNDAKKLKNKFLYVYHNEINWDFITVSEERDILVIKSKVEDENITEEELQNCIDELDKFVILANKRRQDEKKLDNVTPLPKVNSLNDIFKEKYNSINQDYLTKKEVESLTKLYNETIESNDIEIIEKNHIELGKYIEMVAERSKDSEGEAVEIIEVDDDKPVKSNRVPNPNVTESNVSFDEIAQKIYKEPDPKILRGNGTKLEKLIRYKNSEVNGRKVYLPDSNYEVIVNQVHDRTQINFMYNLMLQNGTNIDDLEASIKEEFIHILYDHCIFPLQDNVTYNDFITSLSPNDLELLFVVFSLVNTKLNKDNILPLHVPYVQCDNCEAPISLKEEMVMDLAQEFKNIYDTEKFISNYKIYRNSNFGSIKEAYVAGEYGQIKKLSFKENSFEYEAYICRPTVQKQILIKANNELIAYRSMAVNFTKRADFLRKTMPDVDKIIDYLNTHSYAQFKGDVDYINKNNINLSDPDITEENKLLVENVTSVLSNMQDVLNELAPVFFAALIIDTVVVSTIDGFSTSFTLTDGDIYEFIEVIKDQLPGEFTQEIAERAEEMDYVSKDVKIFFTGDELGDNLDFYSIYKTPEDLEKVLKENGASEEVIKAELDRVNKIKEDFDKTHRCTKCGHSIYKVGYNTLLFFSITNLSN